MVDPTLAPERSFNDLFRVGERAFGNESIGGLQRGEGCLEVT
jgi:hypothetical protein